MIKYFTGDNYRSRAGLLSRDPGTLERKTRKIRLFLQQLQLIVRSGQKLRNCITVNLSRLGYLIRGHVTKNQPITVLVLLTESLGI